MLHPDISLFREDIFGASLPVARVCQPCYGDSRRMVTRPLLFVHVLPVADPISAAMEQPPVKGTCFVFISPYGRPNPTNNGDVIQVKHQIVSHSDDLRRTAININGMNDSAIHGDEDNKATIVAACLDELHRCSVVLNSAHQIAAFLILRCSLSPLRPSELSELLDTCTFLGDSATASALLSHTMRWCHAERNNPHGSRFLDNQVALLPVVPIPSGGEGKEWCVAVQANQLGDGDETPQGIDVILVCLTNRKEVISTAVHTMIGEGRSPNRVAALSCKGSYLVNPTEASQVGLPLALQSLSQEVLNGYPLRLEDCWVGVSNTTNKWRKADESLRAAGNDAQSLVARNRTRMVIVIADEAIQQGNAGRKQTFSFLKFIEKNPMFYGTSCYSLLIGDTPLTPMIHYKELYMMAHRTGGTFVCLGDMNGLSDLAGIKREMSTMIELEGHGKVLKRVHMGVMPGQDTHSSANSLVYTSGLPGCLELPRIRGRIVNLGAVVLPRPPNSAVIATAITVKQATAGELGIVAWAFVPALGTYLMSYIPPDLMSRAAATSFIHRLSNSGQSADDRNPNQVVVSPYQSMSSFTEAQVESILRWVNCCDTLRDSMALAWATTPLASGKIIQSYLKVCEAASPRWVQTAARSILALLESHLDVTVSGGISAQKHEAAKQLLVLMCQASLHPFSTAAGALTAAIVTSKPIKVDTENTMSSKRRISLSQISAIEGRAGPLKDLSSNIYNNVSQLTEDSATPIIPSHALSAGRIVSESTRKFNGAAPNEGIVDLNDSSDEELDALEVRDIAAVTGIQRNPVAFVDDRWLSLGKGTESASSFEAAVTKTQPSGVIAQKSFSIALKKFSHGVVYVTLPPCEAITHLSRSSDIVITRKLFLCEIRGGEVTIVQKETIQSGPTWGEKAIGGHTFIGTGTEHAFYNLSRGTSYCIIHIAAVAQPGEWLRLGDFIISDGIEFATPLSYVQDVTVDEVLPRSLTLQWDGNCNGYMISFQNLSSNSAADKGLVGGISSAPASLGEEAPHVICTAGQSTQLNNLIPASIYLIRVAPNAGKHSEAAEAEEIIAATPPEIIAGMITSNAYADPDDPCRIHVKAGIRLPSFLTAAKPLSQSVAIDALSMQPVIVKGGGYELTCSPLLSLNHSNATAISVAAGMPIMAQVSVEMLVVKRSNNYQVFSRRVNDLLSTRIGPYHAITLLSVRNVTDTSAVLSWHSSHTSGGTQLTLSGRSKDPLALVTGTSPPSPQSRESPPSNITKPDSFAVSRAELETQESHQRQVITIEPGRLEHKVTHLMPDTIYDVTATCEGNIAEQHSDFRTAPPPPSTGELIVQHNVKLQTVFMSFPSGLQLNNRLLRATILPTRAIYNASMSDPKTVVADVAAAELRGEAIAVQLVQYAPDADPNHSVAMRPLYHTATYADANATSRELLESEPTFLFAITNVRLVPTISSYEVRFTCGMKARALSVGIGSQFVVADEGNSRAVFSSLALTGAGSTQQRAAGKASSSLVQPVVFSGPDLMDEQSTMLCVLPIPKPSEALFTTKVFDNHAVITMSPSKIDSFLDNVPADLWQTGLVQVSLIFVSSFMDPVEVPLPLPPPPPPVPAPGLALDDRTQEKLAAPIAPLFPTDYLHSVIVPLAMNRSLTASINCFFQIDCVSNEQTYFLNAVPTTSAPISIPTPMVHDITTITATEVTPRGALIEWDSKNDLFDITVLSQGVVTFTTKTTRSRIGLDGLLPGTVYHVMITGNMSGGHEGHYTFVTPLDVAQIDVAGLCDTTSLTGDGVLHFTIPPTAREACKANPSAEGGMREMRIMVKVVETNDSKGNSSFVVPAPIGDGWRSQDAPLLTAVATFDPKILQQQISAIQPSSPVNNPQNAPISASNPRLPHLTVCVSASVTEAGLKSLTTTSALQRLDVIGCPRVVFSDDHQFATVYWIGSASHYFVSINGIGGKGGVTGGTLTKTAPTLLLRCADYAGQLVTVSIRSLEFPSNKLIFSVLVPEVHPSLAVLKHTLAHLSVELPPPRVYYQPTEEDKLKISSETHTVAPEVLKQLLMATTSFEVEGTHYSYRGNGSTPMPCHIAIRSPSLSHPTSLKIRTQTALTAEPFDITKYGKCLNPSIEVTVAQSLPLLRPLANARVVAVDQSSAELTWESTDDEFYCTVQSFKNSNNSGPTAAPVERTVFLSISTLKLQSLAAGAYHEVSIKGRRSGDTVIKCAFFTSPAFADNCISFRRHHNGLKYTVLMDDPQARLGPSSSMPFASYMCGDRQVDVKVELLICDTEGTIQETYPLGREPLTLEFTNEMTSLYVRKSLRGVKAKQIGLAPLRDPLEGNPVVLQQGDAGAILVSDENTVDGDGVPKEIGAEAKLLICRAPRYLQLLEMHLASVGPNSVCLKWPAPTASTRHEAKGGAKRSYLYTATIEAIESLSLVSADQLKKHVTVVSEPEVAIGTLVDSTLYRAHVRVDTNFDMHTQKHPAIIIHDEAPKVPSVCKYFITPSKKILSPQHKRYVGGAKIFLDMAASIKQSSNVGLRKFSAVRVLPDNALYVQNQPVHSGGVPTPTSTAAVTTTTPTFVIIPASTTVDNNKYSVDVALNEPATELTHRFEFFRVIEISKEFSEYAHVMNPIQYNEPDIQLIQLVRALSRPQCVMSTSTKAELRWLVGNTATNEGIRYDVVVENMLEHSRQEVQRVAEERVMLEDLNPATAYRILVSASVKDSPCEPLSIVLLTAPKRPKAPKLSTSMLSVVFDVPASIVHPASDGLNATVSTTAVVICEKEQSTSGCSTAVDFLEKAQTRNIFRSTPSTAQRVDLRLRSSKSYKFVFFTSIHHPEAINGIVHSKPTVVDFYTDCFPPQSLHLISRTKGSVTVGWTTPDYGSKAIHFEAQMVPLGPSKDPTTLTAIQQAVHKAGADFADDRVEEASFGDLGAGGKILRALGSQHNKLAVDLFSDRLQSSVMQKVSSKIGQPALHCTFTSVSPDLLYAFRVRQTTGDLCSEWSNTLVTAPLAPPPPVTNLRVTGLTPTTIHISWVPSQLPQEGETMSYLVQARVIVPTVANSVSIAMSTAGGRGISSPPRAAPSKDKFDREEVSHTTTHELVGLTPSCQYRVIVTPVNHYGERCVDKNATLLVRTEAPPSTWR